MRIIKNIFYFFARKLIISFDELESKNKILSKKVLRNEYKFKPKHCFSNINSSRGISFKNEFKIEPFLSYEIQNVFLIGPYGIPFNSNGMIIKFTSKNYYKTFKKNN